jgi:hypothetical protein
LAKRILIGLALAVALALGISIWRFSDSDGGVPLSGQTRSSFVASAVEACLTRQRAEPGSAGLPAETLNRFCGCYAETLAGAVSTADLDRLARLSPADIQSTMRDRMAKADRTCASRLGEP